MSVHSLRAYRHLEARHTPRRAALAAAVTGAALVGLCQWLLPRMPAQVIDLLQRGFLLRDLGGVVLFNDYTGVYFLTFFAGFVALLGVVAAPREEHRLELLLSKPVPAAEFLAARTWPVLWTTVAVGLGLGLACAAAAASFGPHASVSPGGALGASLALTAIVVVQLAALGVACVRIADGMTAVLLGLVVALLPLTPSAVFLYRPDLFAGHPSLQAGTVVANLVWYDATLAWLGPAMLAAALAVSVGLVRAGGRLLARNAV